MDFCGRAHISPNFPLIGFVNKKKMAEKLFVCVSSINAGQAGWCGEPVSFFNFVLVNVPLMYLPTTEGRTK